MRWWEHLDYKIYVHVNKVNGKIYIGQTKSENLNRRWNTDGSGYKTNTHFWNAIQKYGWDNFNHVVLVEDLSLEEANLIEEELIKKYDSTNPKKGYNLRFGGNNSSFSEETINKFKEIRKGTQRGELNNFYGRRHSEETKQKLRENHLNRPAYFKGHKHSTDSKKKISESKKGIPLSDRTSNAKSVVQYSNENDCIKVWTCIMDAVRFFGGSTTSHIVACCKGKRNKAFGYKWRYLTNEKEVV